MLSSQEVMGKADQRQLEKGDEDGESLQKERGEREALGEVAAEEEQDPGWLLPPRQAQPGSAVGSPQILLVTAWSGPTSISSCQTSGQLEIAVERRKEAMPPDTSKEVGCEDLHFCQAEKRGSLQVRAVGETSEIALPDLERRNSSWSCLLPLSHMLSPNRGRAEEAQETSQEYSGIQRPRGCREASQAVQKTDVAFSCALGKESKRSNKTLGERPGTQHAFSNAKHYR